MSIGRLLLRTLLEKFRPDPAGEQVVNRKDHCRGGHENLHAQFMLALHRSGRRSESLSVYHQLRATLDADLGLEPSPRLRRLQHSIQTAAPEAAPAPAPADGAGPPAPARVR